MADRKIRLCGLSREDEDHWLIALVSHVPPDLMMVLALMTSKGKQVVGFSLFSARRR